jgi:ABC-type bacteriocin/lantibiotic exporter with double-glycine peptidase domain
MLNMVPAVIHATASIDRLEELDQISQDDEYDGNTPEEDVPGIRFDNVSFHYATGDRMVVNHFCHDFKAGTKTAFMGETGIGKTTLFRLLLGFIRPTEGSICLYKRDGEENIGVQTRPNFVFVPQGNTLMSGSIRYNLQLANPDATDKKLKEVLHTACADFVNELPQGLDTELGERGKGLSEGQAQRIAIARGLLCSGSVLLLDEISSSLDEPTEQELYKRLFAACKEKTMLFITHRKTVSELCDEVIKL